jgi:hypothetical protein
MNVARFSRRSGRESGRAARRAAEFGGVDLRAQGAGVDEDDLSGDRLEGGAEMLHRLDRDGAVGVGSMPSEVNWPRSTAWPLLLITMVSLLSTRNTLAGPEKGPLPDCHIDLAGSLV